MNVINVSVPVFNFIKYIFIALILTPATETFAHLLITTLAKASLLTTGSVVVSSSRAGFWGLHSHYLGNGRFAKLLILIPAAWLIAAELLLEFSFDSFQSTNFSMHTVWAVTPTPSLQQVMQAEFDQNGSQLHYFRSRQLVDYDLLFDGVDQCQSTGLRMALADEEYVIDQEVKWIRSYRSVGKIRTRCGDSSSVNITGRILLKEGHFPDTFHTRGGIQVSDAVRKRIERFVSEKKLLYKIQKGYTAVEVYASSDGIACITGATLCILQGPGGDNYGVLSVFPGLADVNLSMPQDMYITRIANVSVQGNSQDPVINLIDSFGISWGVGTYRPDPYGVRDTTFLPRYFREIIWIYLSLESNGGLTQRDSQTEAMTKTGNSIVVSFNNYVFVAAGLWLSLLLLFSVLLVASNMFANTYRRKSLPVGVKMGRQLALAEFKLNFSLGYLFQTVRHNFAMAEKYVDQVSEKPVVCFRLMNDRGNGVRVTVLGDEGQIVCRPDLSDDDAVFDNEEG